MIIWAFPFTQAAGHFLRRNHETDIRSTFGGSCFCFLRHGGGGGGSKAESRRRQDCAQSGDFRQIEKIGENHRHEKCNVGGIRFQDGNQKGNGEDEQPGGDEDGQVIRFAKHEQGD